jgi:hypothetical protein
LSLSNQLFIKNKFTDKRMKIGGFLLLLSGWGIVVAALAMLHGGVVSAFILAGFAVEIIGLVLVIKAHLPVVEGRE